MNLEKSKGTEPSVDTTASVRRTFLKRASAGAIITSIPGRSAWATVNGSVVASGHGSSVQGGYCVQILSHGYWKNHTSQFDWGIVPINETFFGAFGSNPLKADGTTEGSNPKLLDVLRGNLKGPGNVNMQMVAMYLNAANHGRTLDEQFIYYPTLDNHGGSLKAFGVYLCGEARRNPRGYGEQLSRLIDDNHSIKNLVDSSC